MTRHDIDTVILKILTGVQAGIDVSLVDGTYILGSADDADIQIFDVSLSPHHAKLVVDKTRVSLQALSGAVTLRSGPVLSPRGRAQELRPLDLVTMGTTRFAVAPFGEDWAGLGTADVPPAPRRRVSYQSVSLNTLWDEHRAAFVVTAAALLFLGFWVIPHSLTFLTTLGGSLAPVQEEALSKAIRAIDFANHLTVRKSSDGTLHVDGAVNTLDERHTVVTAVKQSGIPAVTHILVLATLREELAAAISEQAPDADFSMDSDGAIALTGTMPDEKSVIELLQLVKGTVGDAVPIRSSLKTYDDLLVDVTALGRRTQLSRGLHFKLDGKMIEAEGSVPPAQLDAWAGFLQSYAGQFARALPLRSLVRQQNQDGTVDDTVPPTPFYIGVNDPADGREIDLERLVAGGYTAADLLIGGGVTPPPEPSNPQVVQPVPRPLQPSRQAPDHISITEFLNAEGGEARNPAGLEALARRAIQLAQNGKLGDHKLGAALRDATERFPETEGKASSTLSTYGRLLQPNRRRALRPCWAGSRVTFENVTSALFWLDVISRSDTFGTAAFDSDARTILTEAALSPMKVAQCVQLITDGALQSYYLERVSREPHLARAALRDVAQMPVQISGISLTGNRYFQTTSNQVYQEGSLLNTNTSVMSIGELGVLFSSTAGPSVAFPGANLAWETN